MGLIAHSLTNRRWQEKVIGYAESHDQAIVGDKTLIQHLLEEEIYSGMSMHHQQSLRVSRGIGLHKMIRLISHG